MAPFSSTLIWQHKQPSAKVWHIWLQALHSTFGTQLIIAIPLGGWLRPPHQPTVYIPYDPASDLLYQPGHHQVWQVFTKLPNALVTNSSHNTHTFMLLPQSPHGLPHCLCISWPSSNTSLSRFLSPAHSSPTGYDSVRTCYPPPLEGVCLATELLCLP